MGAQQKKDDCVAKNGLNWSTKLLKKIAKIRKKIQKNSKHDCSMHEEILGHGVLDGGVIIQDKYILKKCPKMPK